MTEKKLDLTGSYQEKVERLETWSGFPVKGIYTPEDVAQIGYKEDLGNAGDYPFTRGAYAAMYRSKLWTKRGITGFGTASETNQRLKVQIQEGVSGLDVIRDVPGHHALDADHPMASGQVGRLGVSLSTAVEMRQLLDGLPGDKVTVAFDDASSINAPVTMAQYIVANERMGVAPDKLRFTIQNDPLHTRYCGFRIGNPIDLCLKMNADQVEYAARNNLKVDNQVNLYDLREQGINAAQELGLGFSIAIAYLQEALKRGLTIDDVAPRRAFVLSCHIDFFEEICKFRAARRMWARIMKERFGAKNPRSWLFRFAGRTAGCSLPPHQIQNNIVRVAYETMASVLGGAQAVVPACFDEPVSIPTEEDRKSVV